MDSAIKLLQPSDGGENVICLHGSLSSSRQWRDLESMLDSSYRVVTPDLYNYGNGPKWNYLNQALSLQDEVELLAPTLDTLTGPIHLVGHSYGAAVALKLAQEFPGRFSSLSIYEPVLINLLFLEPTTRLMTGDIFRLIGRIQRAYRYGDTDTAAQRFIDFWSGADAWSRFTPRQQASMAAKIDAVLCNFEALLAEQHPRHELGKLDIPTICLYGLRSPAVSVAISLLLEETLPEITLSPQIDMGHMGPITHGHRVNQQIMAFVHRHSDREAKPAASIAA